MYAYYPVMNENRVVDVHGNGRAWFTRLDVTVRNGTTAQNWVYAQFTPPEASYIYLQDQSGGALCITAASPSNGAEVYLTGCGDEPYQHWVHVYPDQWVLAYTEMCLDVPGISLNDGTYLQVWSCNGGLNQQFNNPNTGY